MSRIVQREKMLLTLRTRSDGDMEIKSHHLFTLVMMNFAAAAVVDPVVATWQTMEMDETKASIVHSVHKYVDMMVYICR